MMSSQTFVETFNALVNSFPEVCTYIVRLDSVEKYSADSNARAVTYLQ
jgi:hypothetical protein